MAKSDKSPDKHLPLPPAIFHMLLALCDGERHGYALKREILKRTDGKLKLGAGASLNFPGPGHRGRSPSAPGRRVPDNRG